MLPVGAFRPLPEEKPLTTLDSPTTRRPAPPGLRVAGWALHLYTASGSVLGLLAVLAAFEGRLVAALWILLVALVVDGTDGALARKLGVKETIPGFDGARLDDIVDYLTYVFAPVVLLWVGGFLPEGRWGTVVAAVPLLASCFQFCRTDAKTADHSFLGFPSYWNVVAFYAVVLDLSAAVTAGVLLVCSVLVFVPVHYLYPSRTSSARTLNLVLVTLWAVLYAVILLDMPNPSPLVVGLSLAYIAYYGTASVVLTLQRRRYASMAAASRE